MAFWGYPRHLSKSVKKFFNGLSDTSTKHPQGFHMVFPRATTAFSGEPRLTSVARYLLSS
jgi:hypothetical protein